MKKQSILLYISLFICAISIAQNKVSVDFSTQKFIGDQSELNREKYFSMHTSYTDGSLASESNYLFNKLGIHFGRTFGGPKPFRGNKTTVPNIADAKKFAKSSAAHYTGSEMFKDFGTTDLVITDHPKQAFQLNVDYAKVAEFNAEFIKNAYPIMPKYYEVMNEPFVHAKDFVKTWAETNMVITEMSKLYNEVGKKVHEQVPNIMVGGYCSAWPEVDMKDFDHWNTRMKQFMDIAGANMKFFSTHIYDGRNVTGNFTYRSGSNSEAILDLIEAYSYKKWGVVKPHLISEYGYTSKGMQGKPYSAESDGICLVSYNRILMSLMDKPDRLLKAIPFITGKATWFYSDTRNLDGNPYPWVLLRKLKNGTYKYTHLKKFYELWKGVEGKRIDVASNNPDIQVNAFAKASKIYVAINSLVEEEQKVNLEFLNSSLEQIKNITIRRLYSTSTGIPKLVFFTNISAISELDLKAGETVILEIDVNQVNFKKTVTEENFYSKTYLQPIKANTAISFDIENVEVSGNGRATLKMGLGRKHDLSKQPKILVNGKSIEVPTNWAGYDQKPRDGFFGVINVPFDYSYLKAGTNKVDITFPDAGGHVSSLILNVENYK
ncbi:beta-agarase [Lutibacter sp. TH_r2]|uniref:beta-agarase n=1 Tax=Lutibacter sp. TH_r2 TaxID=3082083 RepID=UPI0029543FB4|nr:beta-agarase [Lutibacter sp. TH_r2]MDV7185954.1 beta-agarase [Lutibacter sp. TH_r2]